MIFSFVWMFLTSFKTVAESMQIPPDIMPRQWNLRNFTDAMAGYAFAKLNFRGKNILFSIVLIQMMLPSQIFITPQYQMLAKLGLTNTVFALVFPGIVSAFGTFFLRQAYLGIPDEISEAAHLDGCNQWQTFTKVMVPMVALYMIFQRQFIEGVATTGGK